MEKNKVNVYIASNARYFPREKIAYLKEKLEHADSDRFVLATSEKLKDPVMLFFISVFFGYAGVDRFILGDVVAGLLKLVFCGGGCVFTIVDWFLIIERTKEINYRNVMRLL